PRCTSHQRTLPSLLLLSSRSPLVSQVTAKAPPGCGPRARIATPLRTSHTRCSEPSALASSLPSGPQSTLLPPPPCPASPWSSFPSEAPHTQTCPPSAPPTKRVLSGLQATRRIQIGGSRPIQRPAPAVPSHTSTPRLKVALASSLPSG